MIVTKTKKLKEAKKLYREAFPKEERLPWWVLRLMTAPKGVALTAYERDDEFLGFTHSTATEDILFIMFFAVRGDLRGKGCGSAILEHIKQTNPGKAIGLNVEPLDDNADNGFFDTGYDVAEVGGVFRVLSTDPVLDVEAYLRVFGRLSLGFWRPEITKVK